MPGNASIQCRQCFNTHTSSFLRVTPIKKRVIASLAEESQRNSHAQTIPTAAVDVSVSPSYWNGVISS